MTRDEAQAKRFLFYDDLRGCRHGHTPTQRYTSTGNCVACARQRNTFKPVRVYIKPEQRAIFDQMAKQFGWEVVGYGRATDNREAEDYSDKIPI